MHAMLDGYLSIVCFSHVFNILNIENYCAYSFGTGSIRIYRILTGITIMNVYHHQALY